MKALFRTIASVSIVAAFCAVTLTLTIQPVFAVEPKTKSVSVGIPSDAKPFNGKWYRVYHEQINWDIAKQRCATLGGQLAVIPDEPTWLFVRTLATNGDCWLGATNEENKKDWKWIDGTPFTFKAWRPGQPDNHFGKEHWVCARDDGWNDVPMDGRYTKKGKVIGFICEWKGGPPQINAVAAPQSRGATTYKPDQPQIKVLSEESVNVTGWITAPLDVAVPEQIWENLNFLKEALKDEAAQKPAANPASYQLAVRLCLKMLEDLADRDAVTARAGGAAVLHQKSNLTQNQRDHLTWPQYALEKDERAERKENAKKADKFMDGHIMIEWSDKAATMRKEMQFLYSQFREALRQK